MAGTSRDLTFRLIGQDVSASAAFANVGKQANGLGQTFRALGGTLSSVTGGAFGPLADVMDGVGRGFDLMREHGKSASTAMVGIGVAATGIGAALTSMGLEDQRATQLLRASIEATGNSWSDYEGAVNQVVNKMIGFGHESEDTDAALQRLTEVTQDPTKALQEMGLVADIAAAKHTTLADAAGTVSRMLIGNTKAFKQYGVTLDGVGSKAGQIDRAIGQVAERMQGQASTSAGTLAGRFDALRTRIGETAEGFAKYGPALIGVGVATSTLGGGIKVLNAVLAAHRDRAAAAALANQALAASEGEAAAASTAGAAGLGRFTAALGPIGLALGALTLGFVGFQREAAHSASVAADARQEFAKNPAVLQEWKSSLQQVDAVQGPIIRGYKTHGAAAQDLSNKIGTVTRSMRDQNSVAGELPPTLTEVTDSTEDIQKAAQDATRALQNETDALYGQMDAASAAVGSQDAFNRQLLDTSDALNKGGHSLAANTKAGLDNRQNIEQAIGAARRNADEITKQTGSVARGEAAFQQNTTALYRNVLATGANKGAVDALFRSLGLLPSLKAVTVAANTAQASASIRSIASQLAGLRGPDLFIDVWYRSHGIPPSGITGHQFASGGNVRGASWVGEQGPELFIPSGPGRIVDASESRKMAAAAARASSGPTVNNYVTVNGLVGSPADVAVAVQRELLRLQKNGYRAS